MDDSTRRYYEEHADELARRWRDADGGVARFFRQAFPKGCRILEIGSGSGRDLDALVRDGHDALGVEPTSALSRAAQELHPLAAERVHVGSLPDALPREVTHAAPFEGILCAAVLHHLPRERLFRSVFKLRDLLIPDGRLLLSIRKDPPFVDERGLARDGRFDNGVRAGEIQLLLERAGFQTLSRWETEDALGRADRRWVTLLLRRQGTSVLRPLAQIEGVLGRDRKVATYKLALLRALTEIALTQLHRVHWLADDRAAVPLEAIAERWVLYYWPLFEAPQFLPQMQGEWKTQEHGVGFASELSAVIASFRQRGGMTAYAVQARSGAFEASDRRRVSALLRKLKTVIRAGPVTYAGGSLASGRLFAHARGRVIVAGPLWRELTLMAYWIQDALIIRWAQLVSRLSQGSVGTADVVPALLTQPLPDRETFAARKAYKEGPESRCVWSGRSLRGGFDVDHVVPYALWRNNDLWNLVPTHPRVNARKRDRLPSTPLLLRRRDALQGAWSHLRSHLPERFEREVQAFCGLRDAADLDALFDVVVESVEATSVQRDAERFDLS